MAGVRPPVTDHGRLPLPETPPEAIARSRPRARHRRRAHVPDRTTGESDDLLDHPAVRAAFAADEYLPYWADLWPAARMLAKAVLAEPWPPGLTALEVGCGLGLPGVAALASGLRVAFSDYDATAVRFAADNARLNGFTDFAESVVRLAVAAGRPARRCRAGVGPDLRGPQRRAAGRAGRRRC